MQCLRERFKSDIYTRLAMVCGLFGLFSIWLAVNNSNPVVNIPNPVLPRPNAFDFDLAAGNAITGEKQIVDAVSRSPLISYSEAQKEALVRQNAGAIEKVHQGFAYPYLNPGVRSWSADTSYYTKFRHLASLLSLQAQTRAARGDWSGAAENSLDALRLGEDIPKGSPLLGYVAGNSCRNTGRRPMWSVVEHLNAAQTRAVITRLTDILDRHVPLVDMIQEEKWCGQGSRMEFFLGKWKPDLTPTANGSQSAALSDPSIFFLVCSKKRVMDDYTVYMDQSIRIAQQPYSQSKPLPPLPTDMINRALTLVVLDFRIKDIESETQNRLLLVTLALHAFRLEHSRYPTALAELTPAYLKKLPDDPYGVQGALKYRLDANRYVLYSIGPDNKDDGGKSIDDPKNASTTNPKGRYRVSSESQGDIVAGVNL